MKTFIALLFCVSLLHSHAADINVSELANKMPVGQPGKPLGSRIVLTGTSPKRPMLLTNPLEVTEVDGKPSADRIAISIRGQIKIQEGVTYQLEGYEAGEFTGPPQWLFGPDSPRPQAPFQYHSFFAVTKVIAPAPHQNPAARLQFRLLADGKSANAETLPALGGEKRSVSREVLLDETSVSSAGVAEATISLSTYLITVRFTEAGGKKFAEITGANVGRKLALVFDGEVLAEQPITSATSDFQVNTKGYGPEKAAALGKAMTEAIQAVAKSSPATNQGQPAETDKPDAQLWPPPLDEKRLIGTWVRKNQPIQGVENHTLLFLREDRSWNEAEISGPLTEPVQFKKFANDSTWEVPNAGAPTPQATLRFKYKDGGFSSLNISSVGVNELDMSRWAGAVMDIRHYTRCEAQTAAKLNERLKQKETEPTAK